MVLGSSHQLNTKKEVVKVGPPLTKLSGFAHGQLWYICFVARTSVLTLYITSYFVLARVE